MINDRSLMVSLDPRDRAIQNKKHLIIGKKHECEGKYINLRMWMGSEDGKVSFKSQKEFVLLLSPGDTLAGMAFPPGLWENPSSFILARPNRATVALR